MLCPYWYSSGAVDPMVRQYLCGLLRIMIFGGKALPPENGTAPPPLLTSVGVGLFCPEIRIETKRGRPHSLARGNTNTN